MMTEAQRYLFDLTGYLHLEGALGESDLAEARAAAERYIQTPPEDLPSEAGTAGFTITGSPSTSRWSG